jgi:hypothetical protein
MPETFKRIAAAELVTTSTGKSMLKTLLCKDDLHSHVKSIKRSCEPDELHDYRRMCEPGKESMDFVVGGSPGEPRADIHPRRLLLMAECQIGKTGAFLHWAKLLWDAINVPCVLRVRTIRDEPYPYWDELRGQDFRKYRQLYVGKYHGKATKVRLRQLIEAIKEAGGGWCAKYCEKMYVVVGFCLVFSCCDVVFLLL